jgi:AcrR family transcriptional regulator
MSDSPVVQRRRRQILESTLELMRDRGLDLSMEEVAVAAGVGRRTLFRYFDTRADLLAAAIEHIYETHNFLEYASLVDAGDLEGSMRRIFTRAYVLAEEAGMALWQLARDDHVTSVWRTYGGRGVSPRWLVDLFVLLEGAFAYACWRLDAERDSKAMVTTSTQTMTAAVQAALAGRRSSSRQSLSRQ